MLCTVNIKKVNIPQPVGETKHQDSAHTLSIESGIPLVNLDTILAITIYLTRDSHHLVDFYQKLTHKMLSGTNVLEIIMTPFEHQIFFF